LTRRVNTHTASIQDSSTPVPSRWRSCAARIIGLQGTSLIHTLTGSVCFCGPEPSISRGFGCKTDRLIERVNQTACPAHRSDLSAGRALSLLPERVTRELAGLLTARSCRQTGTTPCRRACPKAVCGGVGRAKSVLQTGTTRTREGISGSGSPMMRPKTLPGSESHTGKTPRSLSHHSPARVETHTATTQDSSTPVPWRWRSRGARIIGSHRPTQRTGQWNGVHAGM